MCNKELLSIVKDIKKKDMSRFDELYKAFEGLIIHFEIKLAADDAGQELTVFLLELVYSMDIDRFLPDESQALNKYIAKSIRNQYYMISKKQQKNDSVSNELSENFGIFEELETGIALKEGMNRLSERQKETVILRYIYGYSDAEIAKMLGITRQAVNRLERRGLSVLREYLEE